MVIDKLKLNLHEFSIIFTIFPIHSTFVQFAVSL